MYNTNKGIELGVESQNLFGNKETFGLSFISIL